MTLRRFGRKFLALGILILGQVLLVWLILHYNQGKSDLAASYDIRAFHFAKSHEKRDRKRFENSTSDLMSSASPVEQDIIQVKAVNGATVSYNGRRSQRPTTKSELMRRIKSSARPVIDLVNDYYPFVDFKFIFPEISPKVETTPEIFMIILVNSGAKGEEFRKRREAIRETWGSHSNCEYLKALEDERMKDLRWLLVFVVGKAGPGTNDDELNKAEAKQHNDMLIGNITDNYINNVVKFFMGQVWASRFDIKYTFKTDDDVYVRIPGVLEYLVNAKFPRPFYGGKIHPVRRVNRKIGYKWTVSWKYYKETHFPRFNCGAFFILSSDLLNRLFNYVHTRKPFHTDDAYVGVAMQDFGVKITTISSFNVRSDMNNFIHVAKDHTIIGTDGFGHKMGPDSNRFLHDRLKTLACNTTQRAENM